MGTTRMNIRAKNESESMSDRPNKSCIYLVEIAFDFIVAIVALIMLSPLILLTALAIKLDSHGPIFFKQKRYGKNCKVFNIYKFRSMRVHREADFLTQAKKNDHRVTRVGKIIRKTSIDELPQLFNVLLGDMSIVGPRPHAVQHDEYYKRKIERYLDRYMVKPGLTGLAQIKGCRGETETLDKMKERIRYDLEYVDRKNIFIDFLIIIKTPYSLISNEAY